MQNLFDHAKTCFLTASPDEKVEQTFEAAGLWFSDESMRFDEGDWLDIGLTPGSLPKPEIVMPRDLPKRKPKSKEGQALLIHSLAHIELTAVNLSWDSIYRYRDMPKAYYNDWVQCAKEEAGHFIMLRDKLRSMGYDYGDFPAHGELWKMAENTAEDMMDRMAVVHRAFEARALDVIPSTLSRFEAMGDTDMVKALNIICNDEIGHVSSATRWFHYRCEKEQRDPDTTFFELMSKYLKNPLKGPFNHAARLASGFSEFEIAELERIDEELRSKNKK